MPFFRKKRDELPAAQDEGFPELEQLKKSLEKIKTELVAREAASSVLTANPSPALPELPEAPRAPGMPELPELPETPEEELEEMPAEPESKKPKPKTAPKVKAKLKAAAAPTEKKVKAARPLFIRVDRFKAILASTKAIGEKIEEISAIMKKLKDIRDREGETMEQWKKEIQELKAGLETIEKALTEVQ